MRRGQRTWTALVEVKTGTNQIARGQLECYLDVAREQGFDAVITISNEIAPAPGGHPAAIDKRKLKKVSLHHWSWTQILTEAVMHKVHRGVADPDQAWILGELIRYLEHPRSGAMAFEDMGPSWVTVREAIAAGTLRPADKGIADVAGRWDQLIRFTALRMGRQLGIEVQPALSRKELAEPSLRAQALSESLVSRGFLDGRLKIPNAVGTVEVTADLRATKLAAWVDIEAPREGRVTTRISWLLRQLKDAPDGLRIDAYSMHSRAGVSALLRDVRLKPELLIEDPKKELKSFRLALTVPMGTKRAQGKGSFVTSALNLLDLFYGSVVQNLKPWSATAPKLRALEPDETGEEDLPSGSWYRPRCRPRTIRFRSARRNPPEDWRTSRRPCRSRRSRRRPKPHRLSRPSSGFSLTAAASVMEPQSAGASVSARLPPPVGRSTLFQRETGRHRRGGYAARSRPGFSRSPYGVSGVNVPKWQRIHRLTFIRRSQLALGFH